VEIEMRILFRLSIIYDLLRMRLRHVLPATPFHGAAVVPINVNHFPKDIYNDSTTAPTDAIPMAQGSNWRCHFFWMAV
jgi:hypothetical protein